MPTPRVTETKMAEVVELILRDRPNRSATFAELRELVPQHLTLHRADRVQSPSRPGEELWHQIVRNLVAHRHPGFSAIPAGIKLKKVAKAKERRVA